MNTYKSTRHAKFLINYHFVWIPKYRKDLLKDPEVKNTVEETIRELSKTYKFDILALEIMPDHIHLFISALPRYSPSELINVIKGATGRKIGQKFPQYKQRDSVWTRAYFVATAGNVSAETIKKYIESQWKKVEKDG